MRVSSRSVLVKQLYEYLLTAAELGAEQLTLPLGDGFKDIEVEEGRETLHAIFADVLPLARATGVRIGIETGRSEGTYHTPRAVLKLVESFASPNLKIVPDFEAWRVATFDLPLTHVETQTASAEPASIPLFRACLPYAPIVHAKMLRLNERGDEPHFPLRELIAAVVDSPIPHTLELNMKAGSLILIRTWIASNRPIAACHCFAIWPPLPRCLRVARAKYARLNDGLSIQRHTSRWTNSKGGGPAEGAPRHRVRFGKAQHWLGITGALRHYGHYALRGRHINSPILASPRLARGSGLRLAGRTRRPSLASIAATNPSSPAAGRPPLPLRTRRALRLPRATARTGRRNEECGSAAARPSPARRRVPPDARRRWTPANRRRRHQPGADRVQRQIARRSDEVGLVHRPRGEAALKQVAGDPRPRVGEGGEAPVRLADRLGQPIGAGGNEDQMNMVGHQAIGPAGHAIGAATLGHQIAIERVVARLDEQRLPPIAALGDVVGKVGDDDAGQTGHWSIIPLSDNYAIDMASPNPRDIGRRRVARLLKRRAEVNRRRRRPNSSLPPRPGERCGMPERRRWREQ